MRIKYPFLDLAIVNQPYVDELADAARRVIASGRYVGGPEVDTFENVLKNQCRAAEVVGVSNGLDALRLILRGLIIKGDLKEGDEVIVPANTYVASVIAIVDAGLTPILAEPSSVTLNLDTERLEEYLSPRVRAVMPVHLYGRACWDKPLAHFVKANNLIVVEDNAQAIGATANVDGLFGSDKTGALGHAAAFSFYPTKNIGALGDAGAVATNDPELAAIVRALANYGADKRYHNIYWGFNCRLDPMQAALINVKLAHLDDENRLRRANAQVYDSQITNPLITKPLLTDDESMVWHQYVVAVDRRDQFRQYLADNGVATDIHYAVPPHLQPCMARHPAARDAKLPVTERLAATIVSLPVSRCATADDAAAIAAIINNFR